MLHTNRPNIVRRLSHPYTYYGQDRDGKWWIWNEQLGWLKSGTGRAFSEALKADTKRRIAPPIRRFNDRLCAFQGMGWKPIQESRVTRYLESKQAHA
jgi:hypothetical protein